MAHRPGRMGLHTRFLRGKGRHFALLIAPGGRNCLPRPCWKALILLDDPSDLIGWTIRGWVPSHTAWEDNVLSCMPQERLN